MGNNFRFKVNLRGIIDILSNHLYSSPAVFVRELLQNATDAINARKAYEKTWNQGKIFISILEDVDNKTLVFRDNGIGLTEEEIHRFLAIIGESSKRDLEEGNIRNDYIGQFGIGLLSCFMVTDEIKITTKSVKDNSCHCWIGRPDGTYSIEKIDCEEEHEFGTVIYLKAKSEGRKYFNYSRLVKLLKYYGLVLPYPIILNDENMHYLINDRANIFDGLDKYELLEVGEEIFEENFIDCITIDIADSKTKGILFISSNRNISNKKENNRIYLKKMLLTEKGDGILPEWAFFTRAIIDTEGLKPTASREDFYENKLLRDTKKEIGNEIINYLSSLDLNNKKLLRRIINIHELSIKNLIIKDIKLLEVFFPYFMFKTTRGVLTGEELIEEKVFYYTDNVDSFKQTSAIYKSENKLLVNGGYIYDDFILGNIGFIYDDVFAKRVEATDVKKIMDDLKIEEKDKCFNLIRTANLILSDNKCNTDVKRFYPKELPALYTIDEETKRIREFEEGAENAVGAFEGLFDGFLEEEEEDDYAKLWLNYNNSLIKKLSTINDKKAISNVIRLLYVQALLSANMPIKHEEMELLNHGIISLIEWGLRDE